MAFPLTLNQVLHNMIDHTAIFDLTASCPKPVTCRIVLNVNALDETVIFDDSVGGKEAQTKRFEVPIYRMRQQNKVTLYLSTE